MWAFHNGGVTLEKSFHKDPPQRPTRVPPISGNPHLLGVQHLPVVFLAEGQLTTLDQTPPVFTELGAKGTTVDSAKIELESGCRLKYGLECRSAASPSNLAFCQESNIQVTFKCNEDR